VRAVERGRFDQRMGSSHRCAGWVNAADDEVTAMDDKGTARLPLYSSACTVLFAAR